MPHSLYLLIDFYVQFIQNISFKSLVSGSVCVCDSCSWPIIMSYNWEVIERHNYFVNQKITGREEQFELQNQKRSDKTDLILLLCDSQRSDRGNQVPTTHICFVHFCYLTYIAYCLIHLFKWGIFPIVKADLQLVLKNWKVQQFCLGPHSQNGN